MAPVLDRIAPKLEGKMAIGKIDCTIHKNLCSEFKVRGYPTLKYALDGDVEEYPSSRDEGSITKFASKMSSPSMVTVGGYEEAMEYAKTQAEEGVVFLGFDKASAEKGTFRQTFEKVARRKKASGHFLWLEPSGDESFHSTKSFVKRIELDVKVRFLEDVDDISEEKLTEWFTSQNVPLVAMLGPQNFQTIGKKGRPLCMAIVDTSDEEQVKEIKTHMIQYVSTSENEKYYYGIMDGKKFNRFLEQFDVKEGEIPQFLVLDVPTKTYWQNATYTNLPDFIKAVIAGDIQSAVVSKMAGKGVLGKLEFVFLKFFPYSLLALLAVVFGMVFLLVPSYDLPPGFEEELMQELEEISEDKASLADEIKEPTESKKDK
jgi:hypothetical protein